MRCTNRRLPYYPVSVVNKKVKLRWFDCELVEREDDAALVKHDMTMRKVAGTGKCDV